MDDDDTEPLRNYGLYLAGQLLRENSRTPGDWLTVPRSKAQWDKH
jgi:hypothetical protein